MRRGATPAASPQRPREPGSPVTPPQSKRHQAPHAGGKRKQGTRVHPGKDRVRPAASGPSPKATSCQERKGLVGRDVDRSQRREAAKPVGKATQEADPHSEGVEPASRKGRGSQWLRGPPALHDTAGDRADPAGGSDTVIDTRKADGAEGSRSARGAGSQTKRPEQGSQRRGGTPPNRGRSSLTTEGASTRPQSSRQGRDMHWAPGRQKDNPLRRTSPKTPAT